MSDGLQEITLAQDWCGQSAGAVVRVDPGRAEWMRNNGFAVVSAAPVNGRRKKRENVDA